MKHPQYELYRAYLSTPEWKAIRMEVISLKKCCERCKSTYRLEVHHKSYRNLFNEGLNDWSRNLMSRIQDIPDKSPCV